MFFDFIKAHYELIISVLLVLISFILALIKKKPVINQLETIKAFILGKLPDLINLVEVPGNGMSKKEAVIKSIMVLCLKEFQFYDTVLESFTSQAIEDILSTPKKKK